MLFVRNGPSTVKDGQTYLYNLDKTEGTAVGKLAELRVLIQGESGDVVLCAELWNRRCEDTQDTQGETLATG